MVDERQIWDFIETYYPNYYSADEIVYLSDLCKVMDDELNGEAEELLNRYTVEFDGDEAKARDTIAKLYNEVYISILTKAIRNYINSKGDVVFEEFPSGFEPKVDKIKMKYRFKTIEEFKKTQEHCSAHGYRCGNSYFVPKMVHLAGVAIPDEFSEKIVTYSDHVTLDLGDIVEGCGNYWTFTQEMLTLNTTPKKMKNTGFLSSREYRIVNSHGITDEFNLGDLINGKLEDMEESELLYTLQERLDDLLDMGLNQTILFHMDRGRTEKCLLVRTQ